MTDTVLRQDVIDAIAKMAPNIYDMGMQCVLKKTAIAAINAIPATRLRQPTQRDIYDWADEEIRF
jgi:hypothetical protein